MAIFTYSAKRGPSETMTGEIEAVSQAEALKKIESMGLVPVRIEESRGPRPQERREEAQKSQPAKKAALRSVRVKSRDLDTFTRQLASLIKAGIPVFQALALIAQQTEGKAMKGVVNSMATDIKDGKMLSETMQTYPAIFNNLYLSMVKSGEKSGTLDQILYRLAEHREREQELRQSIQAAMAYPVLVITVGAGTIFIMLTYFLPKLSLVFKGMKQELPLPTKMLIGLTNFMSAYWYMFLIALACAFVIFGRLRRGTRRKILFDAVKLRVPFLRKFTQNAEVAKFARSLAILLKNGLTVHESLELSSGTLDNDAMKESITRTSKDIIEHGLSLSESLLKTGIFPAFAINMIRVGEESGKIVESLEEIASVYEREIAQTIKIMSSLLEPILILIVGAIVGFIVFAMLLPVFNIGVIGR